MDNSSLNVGRPSSRNITPAFALDVLAQALGPDVDIAALPLPASRGFAMNNAEPTLDNLAGLSESARERIRESRLEAWYQTNQGQKARTFHPLNFRSGPKWEVWQDEKHLGHGMNGSLVVQQRKIEPPPPHGNMSAPELRAVKIIPVYDGRSKYYLRELESMIKFSHQAVCGTIPLCYFGETPWQLTEKLQAVLQLVRPLPRLVQIRPSSAYNIRVLRAGRSRQLPEGTQRPSARGPGQPRVPCSLSAL